MGSRCAYILRAAAFSCFCANAALAPAPVSARGSLGRDQDACLLKVGPDFFYFSGYQPQTKRDKFCEDAPSLGVTTFVFDYGQDELRDMKVGARILRDAGDGGEPVDGPTVVELPPRVYRSGTFSLEHRFDEPGAFVGVVTVDNGRGDVWTARFPFTVGGAPRAKTPYVLIGLAAFLALAMLLFGRRENKRR